MKIAICDDNCADRRRLITHIERSEMLSGNVQVHEFSSGQELLEAMKDIVFVLVFLDVQMEGMDGNEIAKKIREIDASLVLVFYTGYAEPSPYTMEVQPFRYIKKNMSEIQMQLYVEEALDEMIRIGKIPTLLATMDNRKLAINPSHILYIDKYRKYTRIHLSKRAYRLYGIPKDWDGINPDIRLHEKLYVTYEQLKKYGFGWPHDSYLINMNYLQCCGNDTLQLEELEFIFKISRSKKEEFHQLKDIFLCGKYVGRGGGR